MLSFLRGNRFAASTAILAFAGVWLFCPCPAGEMGTASANGSAQIDHDPHACCETKPDLPSAAMSCCADDAVRGASAVISSNTGSSTTMPATTGVVDARTIDHAVPMVRAIGAVSFRAPLLVVLRI
jgi:hypothetical protein